MKCILVRVGLVAFLVLLALPAVAAVNFVQGAVGTSVSASSTSVSFNTSNSAGNLIVVGVAWDPTVAISSVTDGQGNIYAVAAGPTIGTSLSGNVETFYAKNIRAGTNTVTIKLTGVAYFLDAYIQEYSGVDTVAPLDAATGAAGHGTAGTSGPAATTVANDLLFGICSDAGSAPTAGAGFTVRSLADNVMTEDMIGVAPGTYSLTVSINGSFDWVCQMAAFKPIPLPSMNVALSGKFTWDSGAALQGSVGLFQSTSTGDQKIGQWAISSTGSVAATVTLQTWGVYRFELRDAPGNLIKQGSMIALPTLQSGQVQLVLDQANSQVKSATIAAKMGDLVTTGP